VQPTKRRAATSAHPPPHLLQLHDHLRQPPALRAPWLAALLQPCDLHAQARDLAAQADLGRGEAGVAQDVVGHALLGGDEGLVLEDQRSAGAGEMVEIAVAQRFEDALLGQQIEDRVHATCRRAAARVLTRMPPTISRKAMPW
jgi:hypothetical protein